MRFLFHVSNGASDHAPRGEELTAKRAPSHPSHLGADLFRGTIQPLVAKALYPHLCGEAGAIAPQKALMKM